MNNQLMLNFLKLRVIVGALGERRHYSWWATSFSDETSGMFLTPIFTKTHLLAQYHGIKEAACRIHDEYIGTGKVYHLFRFPEELEYELQNFSLTQFDLLADIFKSLKEHEFLLADLTRLAGEKKISASGPISLGKTSVLSKSNAVENLSQHYLGAFSENNKVYPYFAE
jgi:hypothetical protein